MRAARRPAASCTWLAVRGCWAGEHRGDELGVVAFADVGERAPGATGAGGHSRVTRSTSEPKGNHHVRGRARPRTGRPGGQTETAPVGAFFAKVAAWSGRWELTVVQRRRLAPAVAAALAVGWGPGDPPNSPGPAPPTSGVRPTSGARQSPDERPPPPRWHLEWPSCGTRLTRVDSTGRACSMPGRTVFHV